mmetsp:Transcript_76623/g.127659  ORF Transcript_76623/g.127659 Transcript_76623/m.127659 type:complete len:111 (-) Transcript_76623:384-716(-)
MTCIGVSQDEAMQALAGVALWVTQRNRQPASWFSVHRGGDHALDRMRQGPNALHSLSLQPPDAVGWFVLQAQGAPSAQRARSATVCPSGRSEVLWDNAVIWPPGSCGTVP